MFVTFESEITAISFQTTDSCYQFEPQSATTSRRPPVTSYSGMRLPSRCVVLQFSVHYLCKVSLSQGQLCQECGLRWQQSRPRRPFRPLEGSFDGIKPPLRSEELPRQQLLATFNSMHLLRRRLRLRLHALVMSHPRWAPKSPACALAQPVTLKVYVRGCIINASRGEIIIVLRDEEIKKHY